MVLPSVYLQENTNAGIRQKIVQGRVKEALRMSKLVNNRPVYVYIRYVYTDSLKLLSEVSDDTFSEIISKTENKRIC